jgi:hypothetical protein
MLDSGYDYPRVILKNRASGLEKKRRTNRERNDHGNGHPVRWWFDVFDGLGHRANLKVPQAVQVKSINDRCGSVPKPVRMTSYSEVIVVNSVFTPLLTPRSPARRTPLARTSLVERFSRRTPGGAFSVPPYITPSTSGGGQERTSGPITPFMLRFSLRLQWHDGFDVWWVVEAKSLPSFAPLGRR